MIWLDWYLLVGFIVAVFYACGMADIEAEELEWDFRDVAAFLVVWALWPLALCWLLLGATLLGLSVILDKPRKRDD